MEHDAGQRDNEQVDRQHDLAETGRAEAAAQKLGRNIGTARRCAGQKHKADTESHKNTAVEAIEQNLRLRCGNNGKQIDEDRTQKHAGQ